MISPRLQFLVSITIFGFWGVVARSIRLPAPVMLAVLSVGGAVACVLWRRTPVRWSRAGVVVGLILTADILLLILAFQRTDFATVIALHNAGPLIAVAAAPFVTRDPFRLTTFIQVAVGVAAVAVVCGVKLQNPGAHDAIGVLIALLSAFTFAGNILSQRRLMKGGESDYTNAVLQYNIVQTAAYAVIAVVWFAAAPHTPMPTGLSLVEQLGFALVAGVVVQGVATLLFNSAARKLRSDDMARMMLIGAALAVGNGVLVYGERPTWIQLIALAVILAAGLIPTRPVAEETPASAP